MTQHAKVVLDKWVFRAIWVVLFVTVAGFVVKLFEVIWGKCNQNQCRQRSSFRLFSP